MLEAVDGSTHQVRPPPLACTGLSYLVCSFLRCSLAGVLVHCRPRIWHGRSIEIFTRTPLGSRIGARTVLPVPAHTAACEGSRKRLIALTLKLCGLLLQWAAITVFGKSIRSYEGAQATHTTELSQSSYCAQKHIVLIPGAVCLAVYLPACLPACLPATCLPARPPVCPPARL